MPEKTNIEETLITLLKRTECLSDLSVQIKTMDDKLTKIDEHFKAEVKRIDKQIKDIEHSQSQINGEFNNNKRITNAITRSNIALKNENRVLFEKIKNLENKLEQSNASRNDEVAFD